MSRSHGPFPSRHTSGQRPERSRNRPARHRPFGRSVQNRSARRLALIAVASAVVGGGTAGVPAASAPGVPGTALASSAATSVSATVGAEHGLSSSESRVAVYESGTDGYDTFRIPAIVQAADGTLLAFAEGRVDGAGDTGDIDLVLKRSSDGGVTWSELQVVGDNGENVFGNPAPVVDQETGRVVLLTTHNAGDVTETEIREGTVAPEDSRRVHVQHSDDHGQSWSAAREITDDAKLDDWRWYATGPVHGIQLRSEPYEGRLVIPANHSAAPPDGSGDTGAENKYYGAHALYSDDGGETWEIGGIDRPEDGVINPNENTALELNDGRVYFNARNQNGTAASTRAVTHSSDGGASFDESYREEPQLVAPIVQGSTLRLASTADGATEDRLLFSAPQGPLQRHGMRISSSLDEGETWTPGKLIYDGPAAYSDMVRLADDEVGILYEAGVEGPYESIVFERYTTAALDAPDPPQRVTITPDASGHGNDAVMHGNPSRIAGPHGRALHLGIGDHLEVPLSDSLDLGTDPFTLSMWFRYTTSDRHGVLMWAFNSGGGGVPQAWIRTEPGNGQIQSCLTVCSPAYPAPQAYNDGEWHHYALVRDHDEVRVHVDGQVVRGGPHDGSTVSDGARAGIHIGQSVTGADPFEGGVDEIRVHNRALDDDEIAALAGATSPASDAGVDGAAHGDGVTHADGSVQGSGTVTEGQVLWLNLERLIRGIRH